jgi:hypothetical protein
MKETQVREIGRLLVAEAGVLSRELGCTPPAAQRAPAASRSATIAP